MDFYATSCAGVRPATVDETSSPTTTYIRRNFVATEATEEEPAGWTYEEAKLTKAEYAQYVAETNAAKIDYNVMLGNLEDPEEE